MSSHSMGLVTRKVGMTRVFTDDGASIAVTVLDASGNRVSQVRTQDVDGYSAVQVAYGSRKPSRLTKGQAGHLAKAGVEPAEILKEFDLPAEKAADYALGATVPASLFQVGQMVDAQGVSIGKGFAGSIKRHNFSSNRASHGNSVTTRAPGSIGMAQDPGRVFPGKRMAGQMGNETVTVQNLEVVRIDEARQLILVKGAVPGSRSGFVFLRPAVKSATGGQ
ncbi:MAG TPA: 50S ribosomal protein L3 [Thiomonas arsenitoxydans]|uniref:Large ribosomal subunit protein uL3 n=1 Tax=Thiomonas intermedia (strain K12) TaxID=75379 RepID=D5WYP1_THIK1|nr:MULTISPECIES: 50S ribosomal protein L3 [Thiomonas]MDE1978883.1 50S ribosomal protein L3 [Betaproteobacteria bacterium]OZB72869.1 MAG: 50S ribosomal protein L3 [Thiomonas sp. 14-64-326]CQR43197.1 50S ribosomal subunit protein L3 [Thiomonas sp. CB3]MBN8775059.1 50S ribosomal protein L3 [Thiomonas arsenitoxydans]MDE2268432.1 50S ribosomal protein L3 [Betaproteobacteria bacterium]